MSFEQAAIASDAKAKRTERITPSTSARPASHPLRRRSRRLVALALLSLSAPAAAHPEFNPTRTSRYLKVTLLGAGAVRLAYTLLEGEVPAAAARRAIDANHDGALDPGEQRAYAAALAAKVDQGIAITLDGARVHPKWEPPSTGGLEDGRVGPYPFSVDLVGRIEAGRGAHLVTIDDALEYDQLGESELRIEEGPDARLTAGWQGHEDAGRQSRFVWNGPKFSVMEDRSVGFRFVDAAPPRVRRRGYPIALVGAPIGALIAAVWLARSRARQRSRVGTRPSGRPAG